MKREFDNAVNNFLDNWIPPALRDSRMLMGILFRAIMKNDKHKLYMEFKEKIPFLTEEGINEYYYKLNDTFISRPTDCNRQCIERIIGGVKGSILDIASGRGYLISEIKKYNLGARCVGCDIIQPKDGRNDVEWVVGSITNLPFENDSFDTVISTHTLEHIKDVDKAVSEIKRVCRKKLIVVVPRQREYQYTFNLHINFFPYMHNVRNMLGNDARIELLGGDWYCEMDF